MDSVAKFWPQDSHTYELVVIQAFVVLPWLSSTCHGRSLGIPPALLPEDIHLLFPVFAHEEVLNSILSCCCHSYPSWSSYLAYSCFASFNVTPSPLGP